MGTVRRISYVEPRYGESGRHATVSLGLGALDEGDGTARAVVTGSDGRHSSRADATGPLDDAINGRRTSFRTGVGGAFLTAKAAASASMLVVDDSSGFSDGDPIAVFNESSDGVPTSPEFFILNDVPDGTHLDLGSATLAGAMYKGARVVNLADLATDVSMGIDGRPGVKSQLQAPTRVLISVDEVVGGSIRVTIEANDEDEATHFDSYVRETRFRRIEPGWVPDDANRDAASVATPYDVTTFEVGADCVPDGGGGVLVSAHTYYVAVVAKNGNGVRDVDESGLSNVEAITLA